jgi:hypothetical protein
MERAKPGNAANTVRSADAESRHDAMTRPFHNRNHRQGF